MIDRGWRRSGKYCYKPLMNATCCPQYTIRCDATNFKLSKSQKKVLKKMNKFLISGLKNADSECKSISSSSENLNEQPMDADFHQHHSHADAKKEDHAQKDVEMFLQKTDEAEKNEPVVENSTTSSPSASCQKAESTSTKDPTGLDPDRPRCRKAKEVRKERKIQKLLNAGHTIEEIKKSAEMKQKQRCSEKSLEDFLMEPAASTNPVHRLELRLVPSDVSNQEFSKTFEESYSVYQKYQMVIHKDPPEKCTKKQYTRFLVTNPFQSAGNMTASKLRGSFHQQYWVDNKLIAVGVLDLLPHCISSVYFYYDPEYSFLSLGTYGSLREVAFVRELQKRFPEIIYYYMGYYIHSCPKMKYKGSYSPSFLLCPETFVFLPIEKCLPKLDISRYQRLEEDPEKNDENGMVQLSEVMILYCNQAMTYTRYCQLNKHADDEDVVEEYANLIGRKCYRRVLLYRS